MFLDTYVRFHFQFEFSVYYGQHECVILTQWQLYILWLYVYLCKINRDFFFLVH